MDTKDNTANDMNKWLSLSETDRVRVLSQISVQKRLSSQSIEKDWWVTMVLKALFSTPFAEHLSFKGGTSLSKCWNLIERFSEDIDIAINREYFGFGGELSKKQIGNKLRRASCTFTREILTAELKKQLLEFGIDESLFTIKVNITSITTTDPEIIEVHYKSIFDNADYIQNRVLIEVSGRSMKEPTEKVNINSIISQSYQTAEFADADFEINVVSPKRTFLEKAFLLHEEFYKPTSEIRIDRMSRHIYDLEKLMDTQIAEEALADTELYNSIIEHRQKLIGLKDFDYSTLKPETLSFVPPTDILKEWEADYKRMQESMIYGDSLPFEKLMERIEILNKRFSSLF